MSRLRLVALASSAALMGAVPALTLATPITITTPFMNLENRAVNSLGFGVGQFVRFGANSVVPNGANGTTGVAVSTNQVTNAPIKFNLNPDFAPATPNFFSRYLTDTAAVRGDWTLNFTNGTDTKSTTVSLDKAAVQAPFVTSITLSGTGDQPTFTWTPPDGAAVNGYRVNIYDKTLVSPTNSGNVLSASLQPGVTSFTVKPSNFTAVGGKFDASHQYSVEISLIQTKDGTTNLGNNNLKAIARTYADWTPQQAGSPVVNLPVVLDNGSYKFNMTVQPGITYYIDPEVAIGYDYATGAGDPNFKTVDLPDTIGDGLFDIWGRDSGGVLQLLAANWKGTDVFDFGGSGLDFFRILGIETSANLNPGSTTAFVTGLTFTGAGNFTGTQTPITVTVGTAPEPSALALVAIALAGLGWRRRAAAR